MAEDQRHDWQTTALYAEHIALGARMVPFSGYGMPVSYPEGILAEHHWTRNHAGLFDVSHMGPCFLVLRQKSGDPENDHAAICALIEPLVSSDIVSLKPGRIRYTLLLNDQGGIEDDLMVSRGPSLQMSGGLFIIVNAGTKEADFARLSAAAGDVATLTRGDRGGLLALQGPEAVAVIAALVPDAAALGFMEYGLFDWNGTGISISRSGYTGEDGFEIRCYAEHAVRLWNTLLADERVKPAGLGARDSLRLEAGLPLYGHDLDATVSPVEADLRFAVSRRRREAGDLAGADRIAREWSEGPQRVRIGLRIEGAPAREGATIRTPEGTAIGVVTSGGFSPSLGHPIAMGFVPPAYSAVGTVLDVSVRGHAQRATVTALPFVPHRYVRISR